LLIILKDNPDKKAQAILDKKKVKKPSKIF